MLRGLIRVAFRWLAVASIAAPMMVGAQDGPVQLEVWHTFGASSTDERIFLSAVESFKAAHPGVDVEPVRIPYLQNLQQFINSSQGGEAPDVVRLSDTDAELERFLRQ